MTVIISQEESSRKRMKRSNNQEETKIILGAKRIRPSLPDLVIHRIITELMPVKDALRMSFLSKQWEGAWSLSPVLDFDEFAEFHDDDIVFDKLVEHNNFIGFLQKYLEYRQEDRTTQVLDKFRLRMTRYLDKDARIVHKWLKFAYKRSVKEVELSLKIGWHKKKVGREISWEEQVKYAYCISPMSLFHAKFVTTLNLEFVRIQNIYIAPKLQHARVLPSLKNMSLKSVYLDFQALGYLILEGPSIECLSLDSCCFEEGVISILHGYSLKYLKLTNCNARGIEVEGAENLESFTFLSEIELLSVTFKGSCKLKYISIHARYLKSLSLRGCHDSLEAAIHASGLVKFWFNGSLNSKIYLKDPNLKTCIIYSEDRYNGKSHNFQSVRDFLQALECGTKIINLYISDFRVITFPEKFREANLSPLPRLEELFLTMTNISPTKAEDFSDLKDSLTWMVPYGIHILRGNY